MSNRDTAVWNLFDDFWTPTAARREAAWNPACEVEETEDHYLLTLEMPGVPEDQIKLEVVDQQLTVSGERRAKEKQTRDGTYYTERRFGSFMRSFSLPAGVDGEKIEANYEHGLLRIYVPKAATAKPRQIKIGASTASGAKPGFFGRLVGDSNAKHDSKHESKTG